MVSVGSLLPREGFLILSQNSQIFCSKFIDWVSTTSQKNEGRENNAGAEEIYRRRNASPNARGMCGLLGVQLGDNNATLSEMRR